MTVKAQMLDPAFDGNALAPERRRIRSQHGHLGLYGTRRMQYVDKARYLQKAQYLIVCVDHGQQTAALHETTGAREQKRQSRGIDEADIFAIDQNASRSLRYQGIDPRTQYGHGCDVDIARRRDNRYVAPLIHTFMVPYMPLPDTLGDKSTRFDTRFVRCTLAYRHLWRLSQLFELQGDKRDIVIERGIRKGIELIEDDRAQPRHPRGRMVEQKIA